METEKWEKLAKTRFAKAKERLAKSKVRLAYMDPDGMLFIHEEMKAALAVIEANLEELNTIAIVNAEVKLAEAEVKLAKAEAELLVEMIEFDVQISRESKKANRFITEEAVRLAEAEVRLAEAEVRDAEMNIEMMDIAGLDGFLDSEHESGRILHEMDMALSDPEYRAEVDDSFWKLYHEMSELANFLSAEAQAKMPVAFAEGKVRLAEAKVRLSEAELRLAKTELRLAETFDVDDYL